MPQRHTSKSKYERHRQEPPSHFIKNPKTRTGKKTSMKTVPLSHTDYKGKKYAVKGAKAIVGILKPKYRVKGKSGLKKRWKIQSILIPKKK